MRWIFHARFGDVDEASSVLPLVDSNLHIKYTWLIQATFMGPMSTVFDAYFSCVLLALMVFNSFVSISHWKTRFRYELYCKIALGKARYDLIVESQLAMQRLHSKARNVLSEGSFTHYCRYQLHHDRFDTIWSEPLRLCPWIFPLFLVAEIVVRAGMFSSSHFALPVWGFLCHSVCPPWRYIFIIRIDRYLPIAFEKRHLYIYDGFVCFLWRPVAVRMDLVEYSFVYLSKVSKID